MSALLVATLLLAQASQRPPCDVAADETYAYTKEQPVQVGGSPLYGASRQRRYLDTLRGPEGQPVKYRRIGSFPAGEDVFLDGYEVTYEGLEKPVTLYLDWYHYNPLKAPRGFSCAQRFDIGMPPLDPFRESRQIRSVAVEQGATRDFEPIPITADGVAYGAIYDHFRLIALWSRAAGVAGETADPKQLPAHLQRTTMVMVGYPPTCEETTFTVASVLLIGPDGGPVPRETRTNLSADAVARLLPGVSLPKGAVAVAYQLARPRPHDRILISYMENGCGVTNNSRFFPVAFTPARGVEMPSAILPDGIVDSGAPMLLQVVVDTDGKIQRPEYIGGAQELLRAAIDSLSGWRVEPARVNGGPVASGVVLQVRFAAK